MKRSFRGVLLVAGILALFAGSAQAQGTGTIFGKVTDASGGVLPGVTVTVAGPALQQPLSDVTQPSGAYQFPIVPIGTYTVTFELSSFKKAVRAGVIIVTNFNAQIDQKMEVGAVTEQLTVSAAPPVVDTKKTGTGSTFTAEILEKIPTARDPWQIVNMTPGVQAGLNVGGSASGQQVSLQARGTSANVQWNLEGGSITDLSSNSSPSYFNFDSFEQIQVVDGGGDVSVQSSGLSINLVTKSGSNVFKGTAVTTFENASMQAENVTPALFYAGSSGFLSGNPLKQITNDSVEYGGPIKKNRLWFWGAADDQNIQVGVLNFFDPTAGALCQTLSNAQASGLGAASVITYPQLSAVEKCLKTDLTVIKDLEWKFNYQLNASNKIQWLFTSDNKYRNARSASASTAPNDVFKQTSDKPWDLPLPTHSITHTLILSDKLVFNNQWTYVDGGFYLDYQDSISPNICGLSKYTGNTVYSSFPQLAISGGDGPGGACLFNTQSLSNRTTGYHSQSLGNSYQTERKSYELKTDGTYFLSNVLGGDHSLKFGVGWRKNPILTYSHYSGGAHDTQECVGNATAGCGAGNTLAQVYPSVAPAAGTTGYVGYQATLYRDDLRNDDWWTYNGYVQDSYSRGKLRLNGGVRYDWQQSSLLAGCVANNPIMPAAIPSQCQTATNIDPTTLKPIQSFGNLGPRLSATYDLAGNGKTQIHGNYAYYYATKITLADALTALDSTTTLSWGANNSNGTCSTVAGANCFVDFNGSGIVTANDLIGVGNSSSSRFVNGVFAPGTNLVDPSAKLGRTREAVVGLQHELVPNVAVGVDYIYRKYDLGTSSFLVGYQPGAAGFPLGQQLYNTPAQTYTDPISGISAPYYVVCAGCDRAPVVPTTTVTALTYQTYSGVDLTVNKRFSKRWQLNSALTIQTNPGYTPFGSYTSPTGVAYTNGISTNTRYLLKMSGSVSLPWDINLSENFNVTDGGTRTITINGPGNVQGGCSNTVTCSTPSGSGATALPYTPSTISYSTLTFQPANATRYPAQRLLDIGAQKVIKLGGGKYRVKLAFDAFNIFNVNTITSYSSSNLDLTGFTSPSALVPPRVYRVGATFSF